MIALLVAVVGQGARNQLFVCDVLKVNELALVFVLCVVEALASV